MYSYFKIRANRRIRKTLKVMQRMAKQDAGIDLKIQYVEGRMGLQGNDGSRGGRSGHINPYMAANHDPPLGIHSRHIKPRYAAIHENLHRQAKGTRGASSCRVFSTA